ncbi:hypothetical protein BDW67DRAFT_150284, partial [Aspergillus spinulosporus]
MLFILVRCGFFLLLFYLFILCYYNDCPWMNEMSLKSLCVIYYIQNETTAMPI